MSSVIVHSSGSYLTLNASASSYRFHAIWLRDNAQDAATRASGNGQRLIALRDIPTDTRIAAADISSDAKLKVRFEPEQKTLAFDLAWLQAHAYDQPTQSTVRCWLPKEIQTWNAELMNAVPCGDFAKLHKRGSHLRDWLGNIVRY